MINKKASEALQNAINQIKQDLKDLESWFPVWEQGENGCRSCLYLCHGGKDGRSKKNN